MKQSNLFLRDLTCIDHAAIDQFGSLSGMSYNADVDISGPVDEEEQVVVDFSKCKKLVKDLIDDYEDGFDHKCWVQHYPLEQVGPNRLRVKTEFVDLTGPSHMFRQIPEGVGVQDYMSSWLTEKVSEVYPGVTVKVWLRPLGFYRGGDARFMFRYAHGLKHSSSCGCKRIAHGHLSFVEARTVDYANRNLVQGVLHDMQSYIRNTYFCWRENVLSAEQSSITIQYTCDAGDDYSLTLSTDVHNVIVLDTETTVENLTEWLVEKYRHQLENAGITRIYMSEGLMKGSYVDI